MNSPHAKAQKRDRARLLRNLLTTLALTFAAALFYLYWQVIHGITEGSADNLRQTQDVKPAPAAISATAPSSSASAANSSLTPARPTQQARSKTAPDAAAAPPPTSSEAAAAALLSLPGAANHSILLLSDAAFASTPLSEMLRPYGESDGGGSCSLDFGNTLVNRWRDTRQNVCGDSSDAAMQREREGGSGEASGPISASRNPTSIDTYLVRQSRHHGNGDNLIHMRNVAVDLGLFADRPRMRKVVQEYVRTQHMRQPYVSFPPGFVQGSCKPDEKGWKAELMPGWNADLTVNAYTNTNTETACSEWIHHPVLIIQRDTFANFFHDSEDFINAFLALAILQWSLGPNTNTNTKGAQIFLTDLYPEGPFWEIWSQAFSGGHNANTNTNTNTNTNAAGGYSVLTSFQLGQRFKSGQRVCFSDLAVGIYGPAAPITVASWDTPCRRTALVRAYSDFVIRGLGLQGATQYAYTNTNTNTNTNREVVVTFMARRASSEWPEKRFCDDTHSFFECAFWKDFGIRSLGRMVRNEAALIAALKALESDAALLATLAANANSPVTLRVQAVDYNLLTLTQQIDTDIHTDIMIGPHGAGLMHNIFMKDEAALVELFIDGSGANRHFHNLASWYGRRYRSIASGNPVDTGNVAALVRALLVETRLR